MLKAVIWAAAVARKEEATLKHLPDEYKEPANEPQQLLSYIFQVSGKLCSGWCCAADFSGKVKGRAKRGLDFPYALLYA